MTSDEDASDYDTSPFDDDRDHDVQEVTFNMDDMAIDMQKSSAHFLFGIKERYKCTQVAELFKEQRASLNNALLH